MFGSVSRDRAPVTLLKKFRLRDALEKVPRTHNNETSIRFRSQSRSLSIWRGVIFDNFRITVTLTLTVGKKYCRASLIDFYPRTKYDQD